MPTSPRCSPARTSRCSRRRPRAARWCGPSPARGGRAPPQLLRQAGRVGARAGRPRPRLRRASPRAQARGPIAKFLDAERLGRAADGHGHAAGRRGLLRLRPSGGGGSARRQGLRAKLGEELDLVEKNAFRFCWVTDFPMYEWDEEAKKIDFSHNPFSMPQGGLEALETQDPLTIKAYQYDIVCNGIELSSGAIRNHRPDIMFKAFEIAGYRPRGRGGALRRNAQRVPLRRAAARGLGPGHRPHRDDAGRRAESPGGHRLPPEPAARRTSSCRRPTRSIPAGCASCTSSSTCRRSAAEAGRTVVS